VFELLFLFLLDRMTRLISCCGHFLQNRFPLISVEIKYKSKFETLS
jgi:hypothetical protein